MTTASTPGGRLEAVLSKENAALLRLDIAGASDLLAEKLAAARDLEAAPPSERTPEAAAMALRLRDLAQENRRLLERAILVQSRVVEVVARAAYGAAQGSSGYGANGAAAREGGAIALVKHA